jgi:hypothetical protein
MTYIPNGRPPGPKPKLGGTVIKRGDSTQFVIYLKLDAKAAIVRHVKRQGQRVSRFILNAALEKVAQESGTEVRNLVSKSTFAELQRLRGRSVDDFTTEKRISKAVSDAKRALASLTELLGEVSSDNRH